MNEYIARNEALEWGKLRTGTVGISGTDYVPPVPEKEKTIEELKNILSSIHMQGMYFSHNKVPHQASLPSNNPVANDFEYISNSQLFV